MCEKTVQNSKAEIMILLRWGLVIKTSWHVTESQATVVKLLASWHSLSCIPHCVTELATSQWAAL